MVSVRLAQVGCTVIEKAATEKAVRDIDDRLAPAVAARQKAKAVGQQFFDATRVAGRFPTALPDRLRPAPGAAAQQRLYEDFARLPRGAPPALVPPAAAGMAGPLRQVASPAMMAGHPSQVWHPFRLVSLCSEPPTVASRLSYCPRTGPPWLTES